MIPFREDLPENLRAFYEKITIDEFRKMRVGREISHGLAVDLLKNYWLRHGVSELELEDYMGERDIEEIMKGNITRLFISSDDMY